MELCKTSLGCLTRLRRLQNPLFSQTRDQRTQVNEHHPDLENHPRIDTKTIKKLERLSLVDFGNEAGIKRLEAAIKFAEKLKNFPIDDSVEPLYCILEKESLRLREDKVTEGNCREKVLKNAIVTEDEYFVAPPGNIPLEQ
ncbi:glutamyl-tRNA(Gln) amidotransferase subunit C, mitochondrial [Fopius arisanus]|uniref:Glutamyl-tRNA(Gln) amidotransferase subunit C, mitochondrial n=1 Tax=Fopius arisanus TaxID=64838 RepID=A0A9R1T7V5_9HYME|nr:PREDICTED: glutamyl-tRNA(Gln) amidotransferase subunit C, mitochondrial [Fopius arisanus]XP_011304261.1 PREDICTED: glutamyl-tRNA(Gln) amidotransferase subunit C, mitochondrial [Fopius arisanus]